MVAQEWDKESNREGERPSYSIESRMQESRKVEQALLNFLCYPRFEINWIRPGENRDETSQDAVSKHASRILLTMCPVLENLFCYPPSISAIRCDALYPTGSHLPMKEDHSSLVYQHQKILPAVYASSK